MSRERLTKEIVVDTVTHAVVRSANELGAKLIVALTESGFTPRMVARHRPKQPLLVLTPDVVTRDQMALSFGCHALLLAEPLSDMDEVLKTVRQTVLKEKLGVRGDRVVIVAGVPFGKKGATNMQLVITL